VWHKVKARFDQDQDITGEGLYDIACEEAERAGYELGVHMAGHLIGSYPHERIPKDKVSLFITKGNQEKVRSLGKDGMPRHWILEIHLHNRGRGYGGFMEQLLTVE